MTAAPAPQGMMNAQQRNGRGANNIFASRYSHSSSSNEGHHLSSQESAERRWANINLSDEKLANIKSPMFLRLESMINTLDKFRTEMDGSRVPKYEVAFLQKKKVKQD